MEYTSALRATDNEFPNLIFDEAILTKAALVVLGCAALYFLVFSLYKRKRRPWASTYFVLLCFSVLVWAGLSFAALLTGSQETARNLNDLSLVGILPLPGLLCLHVKEQVSRKKERPAITAAFFLITFFFIFLVLRSLFFPQLWNALPEQRFAENYYYRLGFYAYAIVALIRAYFLCFNARHQTPTRPRRSTRFMLIGISSIAVLFFAYALLAGSVFGAIEETRLYEALIPLGAPVAFFFLLFSFYNARE